MSASNTPSETLTLAADLRALASGVRALALVFTLFLSYFSIRLSLSISYFDRLFSDMLGGHPLPTLTTWVVEQRTPLILLSLIIPVAAILVITLIRNHRLALYSITAIMALGIIQSLIMWSALFAPLTAIINGMSGQ